MLQLILCRGGRGGTGAHQRRELPLHLRVGVEVPEAGLRRHTVARHAAGPNVSK